MLGTYGLECSIGGIARDLATGLNPAIPLLNYFDTYTGVYLIEAILSLPFLLIAEPIVATKAGNLLTNSAILVLCWHLLERTGGGTAALLGTLALALGPPTMQYHSLIGPSYHYNELLFELGLILLWLRVLTTPQPGRFSLLSLGLIAGLSVTNNYSSIALVGLLGLLSLSSRRMLGLRWRWAFPVVGLLAGISPLAMKLSVHDAYYLGNAGLRDLGVFHEDADQRTLAELFGKAASLLSNDYAGSLGFVDTTSQWLSVEIGTGLSQVVSGLSWLAAASVIAFTAPMMARLIAARRSTERCTDGVLLPPMAALPLCFAGAILTGYLFSEMSIRPFDLATSQFREDRFLPPVMALLSMNLGLATALVVRWLRSRLPVPVSSLLYLPLVLVFVTGLLGRLGMIDGEGLADSDGIPYSGVCVMPQGLYAADAIAGDRSNAERFCAGFPNEAWGDCMQGVAGGFALYHLGADRDRHLQSAQLDPKLINGCRAISPPFEQDCLLQLGWNMSSDIIQPFGPPVPELQRVEDWLASIPDPTDARLFSAGLGFWFGDHYGFAPEKLSGLFQTAPPSPVLREGMALGFGYHLAYSMTSQRQVERLCKRFSQRNPSVGSLCIEGAALYRNHRSQPPPNPRPASGRLQRVEP